MDEKRRAATASDTKSVTTLLLLALLAPPAAEAAPLAQETGEGDDVARLIERLDDLHELTPTLAALETAPAAELVRRYNDGTRAARTVAARRVREARGSLLRIVDACKGAGTEEIALDAMAALRAIGEPREYFVDQVRRVRESPYRAASALRVLADRPDEDLLRLGEAAARACRDLDDDGIAYAAMQRAIGDARFALSARNLEARLRAEGDARGADQSLLGELWRSYTPPLPPDGPVAPANHVYRAASEFARTRLAVRLGEDAAAVRRALEAMTWRDFTRRPADEPAPSDHEDLARRMREQVESLLPDAGGGASDG